MRTWVVVIVIALCWSGMVQAQTANCTVSGYLFNADGSPAALAQVNAISVVNNGSSFVLTPLVVSTDATGFTSFAVPRLSTVWIVATALGFTGPGDAAIQTPDADSATLESLRQSAKSPVSGFHLSSGANPTLALSLKDFGIDLNAGPTALATTVESFNGRTGAVTLTSSDISTALNFTPLDPGTVVGAVNASSAQIDDGRLSSNMVRANIGNLFSAQQTFSNGLQVSGGTQTMTATTNSDMMRFHRWNPPSGWELGAKINSQGAFYTNAWITVSGTGNAFTHPSSDPYMLGIWSDIGGPALQVRSSTAGGGYLFSGLDQAGKYTFSIEPSGALRWGASTRAAMDTNLYRAAAGSLKTDGSLTIGNALFAGASGLTFAKPDNTKPTTPITFQTNENGAGNFYIGMGSSPNPFGVRRDQVLSWGYNQVAGGGDRVLQTEHALAYRIENYWTPNAGTQATESHLVYINRAGVSKRIQSLYIDLNTDAVTNYVTSDHSSWRTSAGVDNFLLTPGLARLMNRTQLLSDTNNYPFLRQKKTGTANAYGTLIYMNDADRVVLGGQGTVGLQIDGASVTPAITGTRFLCISTQGVITSSVAPCSGT